MLTNNAYKCKYMYIEHFSIMKFQTNIVIKNLELLINNKIFLNYLNCIFNKPSSEKWQMNKEYDLLKMKRDLYEDKSCLYVIQFVIVHKCLSHRLSLRFLYMQVAFYVIIQTVMTFQYMYITACTFSEIFTLIHCCQPDIIYCSKYISANLHLQPKQI